MRSRAQIGFITSSAQIRNDIFIPRYYDPRIHQLLQELRAEYDIISIGELVKSKAIIHNHGDYVPKIAYGTGPFPYIRTSDLAN